MSIDESGERKDSNFSCWTANTPARAYGNELDRLSIVLYGSRTSEGRVVMVPVLVGDF